MTSRMSSPGGPQGTAGERVTSLSEMTRPKRPPRSRTTAVYEDMRDRILRCELQPGEKLKIDRLKEHYQVGLGTVREGLARLLGAGLVTMEDQLGFRVNPVSTEDLRNLTLALIDVERALLQRALKSGDSLWETRIGIAIEQLSSSVTVTNNRREDHLEIFYRLERAFFEALVSGARSPSLMVAREALCEQFDRYAWLSIRDDRRRPAVAATHHRILARSVIDREEYIALTLQEKLLISRTRDIRLRDAVGADFEWPDL